MSAGLSWSCAGPKQLAPAQDQFRTSTWPALDQLKPAHDQLRTSLNQLKPAAMLQNIPNQHMLVSSTGIEDILIYFTRFANFALTLSD